VLAAILKTTLLREEEANALGLWGAKTPSASGRRRADQAGPALGHHVLMACVPADGASTDLITCGAPKPHSYLNRKRAELSGPGLMYCVLTEIQSGELG
jgi:hypothetical protein